MRPAPVLLLLSAFVLACAERGPQGASAELEALIERYVDEIRSESAGGGDLPDLSAPSFEREMREDEALLEALRRIPPDELSFEQQTDRMLLVGRLESSIREAEHRRPWENDPSLYLASSRVMRALQDANEAALGELLEGVPARLEHGRKNLLNPPRRFTEAAIFQADQLIASLRSEAPEAAAEAIASLESYRTFLEEELLPLSNGDWAIGRELYDFILAHRWFLKDDAEAILAKGKRAFAETEALAQEVANRIAPGRHWVEVYERLKDEHPPADRLKEAYQEQMDAARAFLMENEVVTLPPGESVITVDTPPAMRRSSPFGTFSTVGPFDGHLQGKLVLTPVEDWLTPEQKKERLRSHHRAWIPIIAVHEAYPGHHVQALKARENPRILRRVVRESIFGEGWGLFTEELMYELGFLEGDDVRLTQLRNRLWRAARVIIDVSLHTGGMSIEEAVDFLVEKVRFERYAAELEVGMYPRNPTYVLGYLIGMLEIEAIRDAYFQKYGQPEKPAAFYDQLLSVGAIPPALVRRELLRETELPVPGRAAMR